MADIKISALPTATSVNDADIFVMDQSLVTKTATRAQILASIKDANNNITANAFFNNLASITASGTPVVLTVASAPVSLVTGSGGQVIKLPDATTLTNGTIFSFNNNQSSGAISVNNNSNTLIVSVPSGGYTTVVLLSNATAAGSWDRHDQSPANVSWSTNTFDYPNGSITNATWNGNTVAINRGGTGATSAASALTSLGAQAALTSASPLALSQGGTGASTATAALTALGAQAALSSASPLAINSGGTGATTQAAALIALAAMATSERANYIPTTQLGSLATTAQLAAITPASIGAMATTERGNYATTTQLAAITPASIGAMATSERATYATTTQVASITASSLGALSTAQAVTIAQGGTGATTQAAALIALAAMATSERVNYIPTTQLASLATTTQVAAITASSLGALSTAQAVTIAQGGTGATAQQAALNAIAGGVTANLVLKGNGTNVVLGALTSADIPTLPIAKLSGVAASGANSDITSVGLTTGTVSTNPSGVTDIVNKAYADSIGSGINFHDACDYGTLAVLSPAATYAQPGGAGVGVNATLTGQTNTALQVDGVTVAVGKRILVKNQASAFQNGVYNVTQQGDGSTVPYILTRASDYDTSGSGTNEVQAGDFILILSSTLANTAWVQQTPAPINFGVSNIAFVQFAAAASGVSSFNTSLTGLTPSTNTTGAVTLAGTLGVASGGTGQTTQQAALNTLAGAVTANRVLKGDGTNVTLAALTSADIPTLNQNTTGTAANVTGVVAIANGGTGATTQQAALNAISGAQTTGYYFRSDGTNVSLQPISLADVTAGTLGVVYGGTGATTQAAALTSLGAQAALTTASPLALTAGGTGTTSAIGALTNLGAQAALTTASPLALSVGGTGQTTAAAALTSLGAQAALTTAAPLAIDKGGTGGINGDDAANNLGFPAQIRPVVSNVNLGTGTTASYVYTATTAVPSFVAHSILTVGDNILCSGATNTMNIGPWIVTTTGYQAVFVGTLASNSTSLNIVSVTSGTVAVGQTIVIPNSTNTITIASFGTFTVLAGTGTVTLSASITTTQTSVTMASGTGVAPVYTRPAWFRGTLPTSSYYFQITKSSNAANGQGNVYSIYPTSSSESFPSVTANASGGTAWSNSIVSQRAANATTSSNIFSNKQILWAGSLGGNIPLAFQAGAIATTPVAHSVEWDNSQMYVTNSAVERLPVATSKVQINNQTGTTYPIVLADAGYLVTLNNTAGVSVTIPTDASITFPIGTQILLMQTSTTGTVTVSAVTPGTTTVVGKNGLKTSGQYAVISLIKIAANSWVVAGDASV
jgi:hypothetical protein